MKLRFRSHPSVLTAAVITAAIVISSFGLVAWAGAPGAPGDKFIGNDTVPGKTGKVERAKDFDKELRELDDAIEQLEQFKNKDWNKLRREVEEAIDRIDVEKLNADLDHVISKIDIEKIGKEIEASLSKIDFDKIQKEVEDALEDVKKVDKDGIKKEIEKAREEVQQHLNNKEWNLEIEKARRESSKDIQEALENAKQEMIKAREELDNLDLKKELEKAQAEVNQAKEELRGYKDMVNEMEKAGLLNTQKDYIIEFKNGEIFIDGKKLSPEETAKYKKYFKKNGIRIKKEDGDLDIEAD